jgi:hypothetical protein
MTSACFRSSSSRAVHAKSRMMCSESARILTSSLKMEWMRSQGRVARRGAHTQMYPERSTRVHSCAAAGRRSRSSDPTLTVVLRSPSATASGMVSCRNANERQIDYCRSQPPPQKPTVKPTNTAGVPIPSNPRAPRSRKSSIPGECTMVEARMVGSALQRLWYWTARAGTAERGLQAWLSRARTLDGRH